MQTRGAHGPSYMCCFSTPAAFMRACSPCLQQGLQSSKGGARKLSKTRGRPSSRRQLRSAHPVPRCAGPTCDGSEWMPAWAPLRGVGGDGGVGEQTAGRLALESPVTAAIRVGRRQGRQERKGLCVGRKSEWGPAVGVQGGATRRPTAQEQGRPKGPPVTVAAGHMGVLRSGAGYAVHTPRGVPFSACLRRQETVNRLAGLCSLGLPSDLVVSRLFCPPVSPGGVCGVGVG